jgi:hypothetical protein
LLWYLKFPSLYLNIRKIVVTAFIAPALFAIKKMYPAVFKCFRSLKPDL